MRNPKNTWNLNLQNVKKMHWLHEQLSKIVQAMDLSDILRAEYVLIVSAFDCYVHDVVLQGMTNMFSGSKPDCRAYNEFCLPMSAVKRLLNTKLRSQHRDLQKYCIAEISNFNKLIAMSNDQSIPIFELSNRGMQEGQKRTLGWFKALFDMIADKLLLMTCDEES